VKAQEDDAATAGDEAGTREGNEPVEKTEEPTVAELKAIEKIKNGIAKKIVAIIKKIDGDFFKAFEEVFEAMGIEFSYSYQPKHHENMPNLDIPFASLKLAKEDEKSMPYFEFDVDELEVFLNHIGDEFKRVKPLWNRHLRRMEDKLKDENKSRKKGHEFAGIMTQPVITTDYQGNKTFAFMVETAWNDDLAEMLNRVLNERVILSAQKPFAEKLYRVDGQLAKIVPGQVKGGLNLGFKIITTKSDWITLAKAASLQHIVFTLKMKQLTLGDILEPYEEDNVA